MTTNNNHLPCFASLFYQVSTSGQMVALEEKGADEWLVGELAERIIAARNSLNWEVFYAIMWDSHRQDWMLDAPLMSSEHCFDAQVAYLSIKNDYLIHSLTELFFREKQSQKFSPNFSLIVKRSKDAAQSTISKPDENFTEKRGHPLYVLEYADADFEKFGDFIADWERRQNPQYHRYPQPERGEISNLCGIVRKHDGYQHPERGKLSNLSDIERVFSEIKNSEKLAHLAKEFLKIILNDDVHSDDVLDDICKSLVLSYCHLKQSAQAASSGNNRLDEYSHYFYYCYIANTVSRAPTKYIGGGVGGLFSDHDKDSLLDKVFSFSVSILAFTIALQGTDWYKKAYHSSIKSAIAAIMSRNMSHNIGSHVLARIIQENPENPSKNGQIESDQSNQSKDDHSKDKTAYCDPLKLVFDDANEALDVIAENSDVKINSLTYDPGSLSLGSLIPRLGRAVHYLEEIYGLCNKATGPDRVRDYAKDIQIFAAYLQQRADFVAQICTDWPQWTAPSCLSNDLMAWFLKQRKILNFIAASEGLKATTFKKDGNRVVEKRVVKSDAGEEVIEKIGGHIGFVMRLIKQKDKDVPAEPNEITPIMNFTEADMPEIVCPQRRVPVAFPGGRVGWHAFFIILEGFIRNTAKHGYSRLRTDHKERFDLNVIIDIIDDGNTFAKCKKDDKIIVEKPTYTVRIYSDVDQDRNVQNEGKQDHFDNTVQTTSGILNQYLLGSFVDSTGKMVKKYWGLSEFRISAGYLQNADIISIGDKQANDPARRVLQLRGEEQKNIEGNDSVLLKPICNLRQDAVYDLRSNGFRSECPDDKDDDPHCNYPRFYYEFKMLKPRVIGMEVAKQLKTNKKRQSEGWEVYSSGQDAYDRDFEFYVLEDSTSDYYKWIRSSLTEGNWEKLCDIIFDKQHFGRLDYYPGRLFVVLNEADIAANIPKREEDISKDIPKEKMDKAISTYAIWWRLRKRVCLLSQNDFKTLQNIYKHKNEGATDLATWFLQREWMKHVLQIIRGFHHEGLRLYHYLHTESDSSKNGEPYTPNTTPFQNSSSEPQNTPNPIQLIAGGKNCAIVFGRHIGVLEKKSDFSVRRKVGTGGINADDIILYAESMSGGASYFSLAEETLRNYDVGFAEQLNKTDLLFGNITEILSSENINKIVHVRTLYQFAETALLRVVLIDERIQEQFGKLENKHLVGVSEQQVYAGYLTKNGEAFAQTPSTKSLKEIGYINVNLTNEEKFQTANIDSVKLIRGLQLNGDLHPKLWLKEGPFEGDVLIIHQGIIDKWHESLETKGQKIDDTEKLINTLKTKFPYVIITSGRGRPDGVLPKVRFLPFSSLDSATQGNLYEKYPLIQQALSIIGDEKEE